MLYIIKQMWFKAWTTINTKWREASYVEENSLPYKIFPN